MATSITSAGIVFPDATVQTTAAGGGGSSLEAVASGSLSDGSTVVVNTDGTVSVVVGQDQEVSTPVVFESASSRYFSATYDSINQKVIIAYEDDANLDYGTAIVGTISGTSISFGTAVIFSSSDSTGDISVVYDSTNEKIVISYTDSGNSLYGKTIVGTVSGTSISFGIPVTFNSATTTGISSVYDPSQQKVVIAYTDYGNSGFGTAIVGTVSGTSISFGTSVVFEAAVTLRISTTYDQTTQKVIIAYQNKGNSEYGTAIIGTVSGTSVSFGTAVVFESAITESISTTYDIDQQKIVIAYRDSGNLDYGTTIVGTVSSTSISFGVAAVFNSNATPWTSVIYDSNSKNIIIFYNDGGNSNKGTLVPALINGTSITFGSSVVFEEGITENLASVYDPTNKKIMVAYRDNSFLNYGTAVVFQNESTNLTAENYIGISDGVYTNGQTATVQLLGSVDDAQSGLTAGQKYYVQTDGTLSQTPGTPEVLAGTAVSATKLVIKR